MYLIAEIGINHNGSLEIAKGLIRSAAAAGFDAVKFQKRTVEKVYSKAFLDSPRESPWGTTQRHQKMGLEFSKSHYDEIAKYCKDLKIDWSASAWDLESLEFLDQYNLPFHKVASPMLGSTGFLEAVARRGLKTFISTGMSSLDEIDAVVEIFRSRGCPFELMHCNSQYPMPEQDANLLCIKTLRDRYKCNVGYSGHESTLIKVCVAAAVLGATSIERHITIDRAMYGSDQAASISAHVLDDFVGAIRAIPGILGTGIKAISDGERPIREKLRGTPTSP